MLPRRGRWAQEARNGPPERSPKSAADGALGGGQAAISRPTLRRVAAGDPAVSIGTYASVLEIFGLLAGLLIVADLRRDPIALASACGNSPQRIRNGTLMAALNAAFTSDSRCDLRTDGGCVRVGAFEGHIARP